MRRVSLFFVLVIAVGVGVAACNSKGTVEPLPISVEGDIETPEITIGDATAGAGSFIEASCGGCHTLDGVDDATGDIGPNLSVSLVDKDATYIQQGIIAPDIVIAEGYAAGIMPSNYGDSLSPGQVADMVALLLQSSGSS